MENLKRKEKRYMVKVFKLAVLLGILAVVGLTFIGTANAQGLNVTILSANATGLDSNNPLEGTNFTTIQVRICNNNATYAATNVWANFSWDDANKTAIYLRPDETENKSLGTLNAGECKDVFWVVYINRSIALPTNNKPPIYRNYSINVTSSNLGYVNESDCILLKRLLGTSSDIMNFITYFPEYNPVCTTFAVVCNFTVKDTNDPVILAVDYDPDVVELINASYTNSTGTYDNISLFFAGGVADPTTTVTYYFHRIDNGDAIIEPMFISYRGSNWKYAVATVPTIPVPELSTVVLFGVGLLALVGYIGYRKRTLI